MIDIEHVVLYDRRTIATLFANNGFHVNRVFGVANAYPLTYWLRMAPLPGWLKRSGLKLLEATGLERAVIRANFGNMGIIAQKREP